MPVQSAQQIFFCREFHLICHSSENIERKLVINTFHLIKASDLRPQGKHFPLIRHKLSETFRPHIVSADATCTLKEGPLTLQLLLTTTSTFYFLSSPPMSSIAGVFNTTPLSILKHVKLMKDWPHIIV